MPICEPYLGVRKVDQTLFMKGSILEYSTEQIQALKERYPCHTVPGWLLGQNEDSPCDHTWCFRYQIQQKKIILIHIETTTTTVSEFSYWYESDQPFEADF